MIRNLVFDLDGTLVDNRAANAEAYVRAFADVGWTIAPADYLAHFGLRFDGLVQALAPHLSPEDRSTVQERKRLHYRETGHLLVPHEPVIAFLHGMKGHHRIGLATTASRANAEFVLEHLGLMTAFDAMIFGEDVHHGKPDPECYHLCIDRLGGIPAETLIFEDSAVGIQAAEAAGAQVVRVRADEV